MSQLISVVILRAGGSAGALLGEASHLRVIGDWPLDNDSLARLAREAVQVAVLDARALFPAEVAPAVRRLRAASSAIRVVVVGPAGDEAAAQQAIAAGASSFQSREVSHLSLLHAIEAVASGEMHLTSTGRRAVKALLGGGPDKK